MASGSRIHVLGDHVINKIAAGEVVERPASVVKELVENAVDAGARNIAIEAVAGGRTLVSVGDDGCGMNRDDALLSLERHATSKIEDVDDIERIATLGFRGEALAAIASVSRFTLVTRPADEPVGTEIQVSGGRLQDVRDAGGPAGTTITVRHLFYNVPARRKFLRAEATELAHIRQVFVLYALSHPDIGFRFTVDERPVYRLPPGARLEDRLVELFHLSPGAGLRALDHAREGVRVRGFAGLPSQARADRAAQYIFVNGRPASAPLVGNAINEAYHTLLPRGRYPAVFLFIDLDAGEVDVNVHPTKKEVRFRNGRAVRDTVLEGLREALACPADSAASSTAGPGLPSGPPPSQPPASFTTPELKVDDLPPARTFAFPRLPLLSSEPAPPAAPFSSVPPTPGGGETHPAPAASSPWVWCRILGQVGGLFVVLETEDGLVLMDPHAAHERILFEKFMKEVVARDVKSQGLLIPETVALGPRDAMIVNRNLPLLKEMGFGLSEFGGDTFIVDAVPACLGQFPVRDLLADIAGTLDQGGMRGGTERWAEERVASAACKAAVKAHDRLRVDEIEKLVLDLAAAEMPYTCPHGRPTLIHMGFGELRRKFGRSG